MSDALSAADVMAMMNGNNDGWQNNPFIYLVWLALLGGGNFFGRNNDSALQNSITRSDLFEGFNNQDVNGQLRGITNGLCDGFYAMNNSLLSSFSSVGNEVMANRYTNQQNTCEINRNIDNVKAEAYQNTCAITSAIHSEGEATRALIQANTIQDLRDRLEAADRDLLTANFQISQLNQNAAIIGALRPFPQPAYITTSPYSSTSVNTCGCMV